VAVDSLTDIAVYVRVVEEGSFTRAAERLDMSRSVISKYITRLEERLGVRLLNRTTRRLSLTEAGRIFYERSRHSLQDIEEAEAEVSRLQLKPSGTLRINSPMSFGILHIAPLIADFLAEYPDINVEMNLDDRKIDIINEGFDVSIRIADMPDSSLVARRLAPCRHVIAGSPSYFEQHSRPLAPGDLADHNILSFSYQASASDWHFVSPEGGPISVTVSGSVKMNNSLAIREALLGGLGLARVPTFVIGSDIQQGRLCSVLDSYMKPEVAIYAVYPQRRHLSPKVRAFVDYLADKITDTPYWD
tara:strand:+ start:311 stop:1219 length:909 start_codon:yes stop_codon:yes gene_type:complete